MEQEKSHLTMGKYLLMLSLVLVLSAFSFVAVFANFEEGLQSFWQDNKELADAVANSEIYGVTDVDSIEIREDVYEIKRNELIEKYIKSSGDVDVFSEMLNHIQGKQ